MITSDEVLKRMSDHPYEAIIRMFLMVSLTFIAIRVNGFLDTYWIAHLSTEASAAVSLVNPIYAIVAALGLGVGSGVCVCISYRLGQHDYETANQMAGTAMVIGLVVSIPAILFLIFGTDIMFIVAEESAVRDLTRDYVLPLAIGAPALIMAGIVTNFLKSEGAMRSMVLCSLVSIPVNAILTPVFVYDFGWGISGASSATVLGSLASLIVGLLILHTGRFHIRPKIIKPTSAHVKEVLGIGLPKTLEGFLGGLTFLVQNIVLLSKVGTECVAIQGISLSIIYLFTVISDSMGAAAQPVCSVAAGARRIESMKRSMMFSAVVVIALSVIVVFVLEFFTTEIIEIYTAGASSELKDRLVLALEVYALMLPFYLLSKFASTLMQVLRKSYVWTPTYLLLINLHVLLIFLFTNDLQSMLAVVTFTHVLLGVVASLMTVYYARRYDPDVIETMIDEGKATPFRIRADPNRPGAS